MGASLKDIILPIEHKGYKITSSVILNQKDSLKLKDRDLIVVNIEGDLKGLKKGDLVGSVESGENVTLLKYRQNVWGCLLSSIILKLMRKRCLFMDS